MRARRAWLLPLSFATTFLLSTTASFAAGEGRRAADAARETTREATTRVERIAPPPSTRPATPVARAPREATAPRVLPTPGPAPATPTLPSNLRPPAVSRVRAHCDLGLPTKASVQNPDDFLFVRTGYVGSFNATRHVPNWIAYKVDSKVYGSRDEWLERTSGFHADKRLPAVIQQAKDTDYEKSGWDRGHEKRSGDAPLRPGNETANHATFSLANVVPQAPNVNRGPWNHLEDHYRDHAMKDGKDVRVIVGNLFEGKTTTIGETGVNVPSHLFKIVAISDRGTKVEQMTPQNTQFYAVVIPNDNDKVRDTDNFAKYLVNPMTIVRRTGWDGMFSGLSAAQRATLVDRDPNVRQTKRGFVVDGEWIKNPLPAAVRRMQEREDQEKRQKAEDAKAGGGGATTR